MKNADGFYILPYCSLHKSYADACSTVITRLTVELNKINLQINELMNKMAYAAVGISFASKKESQ